MPLRSNSPINSIDQEEEELPVRSTLGMKASCLEAFGENPRDS